MGGKEGNDFAAVCDAMTRLGCRYVPRNNETAWRKLVAFLRTEGSTAFEYMAWARMELGADRMVRNCLCSPRTHRMFSEARATRRAENLLVAGLQRVKLRARLDAGKTPERILAEDGDQFCFVVRRLLAEAAGDWNAVRSLEAGANWELETAPENRLYYEDFLIGREVDSVGT